MNQLTEKPKVLLASSLHRWNDVRIFHKEAKSLSYSYGVTVMGVVSDAGFQNREIRVLTLPSPTSLFRRLINGCKILSEGVSGGYAIFHFHDPELLWVGFILKLFRNQVIYDVHENTYNAIQIRTWLPKHLRKVLGKLTHCIELIGQWCFDGIILAEDSYVRNFSNNENVAIVRNYVRIGPEPLTLNKGSKRILYTGAITLARGLGDFLEALSLLQAEDKNISATIVGQLDTKDIDKLHELKSNLSNPENVEILSHVDFSELEYFANKCELAVVPLRDVKNYLYSVPTKILDYMNWGIPYVYSRLPLSYELFGENSGGVSYEPGNFSDLAEKIRYVLNDQMVYLTKSKQGRDRIAFFNWEKEQAKLLALYEKIVEN